MTTVLIADDQELVREGLRMVVDATPGYHVVGEALNGHEAVAMTRALDADVVLMDIRMPVMDGIEATRQLVASKSRAKVLVLTTFDLDEYVYAALKAGASGFLLKDATREQLIDGIAAVVSGESLLAPAVTRRLIEDYCRRPPPTPATTPLTRRELDVVRALSKGLSNAEIATTLFLGETTVKSHITRSLEKLQLRDRVQLVVYAFEQGLTG